MFFVSEGYNLRPKGEPSIIEKLAALDIDINKIRIKHSLTSSSYYSDSTAPSVKFNEKKSNKEKVESEMTKSLATSKRSIKSKRSQLSLEDKLLKGFFKVGEL